MVVSGKTGFGLPELWQEVIRHQELLTASGELEVRRREQGRSWMWSLIRERLMGSFLANAQIGARLSELEEAVLEGSATPTQAASELLVMFQRGGTDDSD